MRPFRILDPFLHALNGGKLIRSAMAFAARVFAGLAALGGAMVWVATAGAAFRASGPATAIGSLGTLGRAFLPSRGWDTPIAVAAFVLLSIASDGGSGAIRLAPAGGAPQPSPFAAAAGGFAAQVGGPAGGCQCSGCSSPPEPGRVFFGDWGTAIQG